MTPLTVNIDLTAVGGVIIIMTTMMMVRKKIKKSPLVSAPSVPHSRELTG